MRLVTSKDKGHSVRMYPIKTEKDSSFKVAIWALNLRGSRKQHIVEAQRSQARNASDLKAQLLDFF